MTRHRIAAAGLLFGLFVFFVPAAAEVTVGEKAPEFTGTDSKGVAHTLSGFQGKTVILEWLNHDCPFVVKHYKSGNMQELQKMAAEKDIVWLSVISSAPGKQGHVTGEEADALTAEKNAAAAAVILDPEGTIGRLYDAKTTPHMFIIDPNGILVYNGAIDSIRSANIDDVAKATCYIRKALADMEAGRPVETAVTPPYGCTVKY